MLLVRKGYKMSWIIGIIIFLVLFFGLFFWGLSKQKTRDILKIFINKDEKRLYLLLSDDNYMDFDISNVKDEDLNDTIKDIVKSRAFELKNLIEDVNIIGSANNDFEEELLSILKHS